MKKSGSLIKSIFAVCLAVVMTLCVVTPAFAKVIIDEEQKTQYLYTFNYGVNSIKEKNPSFRYKKTAGISTEEDADIDLNLKTAAGLSDEARKYLSILVDAFFNPEKGVVNNFIAVLTETDNTYTEEKISKGLDTTDLLPVQGKEYVSALAVDDAYTLRVEDVRDILEPANNKQYIRYEFDDYDLESAKGSVLEKVFDLPSGAINPVLIGGASFDEENDPLDDVKFADFKFHNAWVQANFNYKGELEKYTQNISYTFAISFYDMMRIFDVYTNIDLMEIGIAIANTILVNTGNPEVTAREVLKKTEIVIRYDIKTELYGFDWNPRYFGDIDNNGRIDAYDARSALRYSVALEEIEDQEALIYGDVDFDGVITAADARLILRTSVDLEEEFSEVPEGESIKIVVLKPPAEEPEEPEESENPEEPENPDEPEEPENPDEEGGTKLPSSEQVSGEITEFIDTIFDVINGVKGDGVSYDGISGLIQQIKDIVDGKYEEVPPDELIKPAG